MKRLALVLAAACGSDDTPTDVSCKQQLVYLNRNGGTYNRGDHDTAIGNLSILVDAERVLPPWPHDDVDWQNLGDCIRTALAPIQRITVTEDDPGMTPHIELVFTTSYWAGAGTTHIVPAACRTGYQLEFVFGDAIPTSARACHLAMQGFAQMTAQLSLGSECHDFVNNAQDCSPTRAFLDATVDCVDASNQPTACRCGGTMQNTLVALESTFPACP